MPEGHTGETVRRAWGEALKTERKSRRLWQTEVAQMADLSQGTVSEVENGQGSLDSFLAIAKVLEVDLFAGLAS